MGAALRYALSLFLALWAGAASGQTGGNIYQCDVHGTVTYADHPCGQHPQKLNLPDNRIGGRFNLNLPQSGSHPKSQRHPPKPAKKKDKGCPVGYLSSTELNRLRIDRKVRPGMSKAQVRAILGPPDHINEHGQWVYMYQYWVTGRYLFVDGCLKASVPSG